MKIALRSWRNRLLTGSRLGRLTAVGRSIGKAQRFRLKFLSASPPHKRQRLGRKLQYRWQIAVRSKRTGRYLVALHNGGAHARTRHIGSWEKWSILRGNALASTGTVRYGQSVVLWSYFKKFLVAESNGEVNANRRNAGPWERFRLVNPKNPADRGAIRDGSLVAFHTWTRKYVGTSAGRNISGRRRHLGLSNIFQFKFVSSRMVARPKHAHGPALKFQSLIALKDAHRHYLSAVPNGRDNARGRYAGHREKWVIVDVRRNSSRRKVRFGSRVALQSVYGGFFSALRSGHTRANRRTISRVSTFTIVNPRNHRDRGFVHIGQKISLRSYRRVFVVAEKDRRATVNANRRRTGAWERFTVKFEGKGRLKVVRHRAARTVRRGHPNGKVQNMVNGHAIGGVRLRFIRRGKLVHSLTTRSRGFYGANLPQGTYSVVATKTGYITVRTTVFVRGGRNVRLNINMSPTLPAGQYRIAVTWGKHPKDLDSYFTTPGGCTISYRRKRCTRRGGRTELDLDAVHGFGPETITIKHLGRGMYSYKVHQYSRKGSLASSGAQVVVYKGSRKLKNFKVGRDGKLRGRYWHVFTLDGRTGEIRAR